MIDTASHRSPIAVGINDDDIKAICAGSAYEPRRRAGPGWALLVGGALILALAGCESSANGSADAAASADATETAGADDGVVEERMSTVGCDIPNPEKVHFRVANAVFAVPGDDVRTVLPPGVTPRTPAEQVIEQLRTATQAGAGCPESPLEAAMLAVAGPPADPLVADSLMLFRSGGIARPYGDLTSQMLATPEKCQDAGPGLIACQAVERDGDTETRSLYIVSTEKNRRLAFGGPLAARCVIVDEQIRGCEIVDELPGGVGLRAPLTAVPQSSAALAAAHQAVLDRIQPLRL